MSNDRSAFLGLGRLVERIGGVPAVQWLSGRDTELSVNAVRSKVHATLGEMNGHDQSWVDHVAWTIAEHPRLERLLSATGVSYDMAQVESLGAVVHERFAAHDDLFKWATRFDVMDASLAGVELPFVLGSLGAFEVLATPVEVVELLGKSALTFVVWRRTKAWDLALRMVARDALSLIPAIGDVLDLAPAMRNLVGRTIRREAVMIWEGSAPAMVHQVPPPPPPLEAGLST